MRALAVTLGVLAACGSPKEPAEARRAPAQAVPAPDSPAVPSPRPLDPRAAARLKDASNTLATHGCDLDALEVVRELQRSHGDLPPLVKAQRVAFVACQDQDALAELMGRTTPEDASAYAHLELAAAWVRAARYPEAVAVLEPLVRSEGDRSAAAWLLGFALFHAGESKKARPLLESARHQAAKGIGDPWLLIGLCKLHERDVEGATAEFEAGVKAVDDDPSLWTALSRAYATSGRSEDAARAEARANEARAARTQELRTQMWLAALATALRNAAAAQSVEDVERVFERMWPDAPPKLRQQMLELRAGVYAKANLDAKAKADLARAEALRSSAAAQAP